MAEHKFRIQPFRTNDLVDSNGKQFELGRSWCEDFFGIPSEVGTVSLQLTFKALSEEHKELDGTKIELKLSEVNMRGDRKAYVDKDLGYSPIKDFFIHKLRLKLPENNNDFFAIYKIDSSNYYLYFVPQILYDNFIQLFKAETPAVDCVDNKRINRNEQLSLPLQQIFYGAPGTGKSHTIKERTEGMDVIRTTFHPDTDYATFVGAYKPTTKSYPVTTVIGTKAVAVEDKEGKEMTEDKIVYEFVPQAFLQAYVAAWRKLDKVEDLSEATPEYLVIEEINRGNCAQIFGDLFQLLDRGDGGFSEYSITADTDMKRYLHEALKDIDLNGIGDVLNAMFKGKDIAHQVKEGDILLLPCNLCIWATMNTSDQSLFPIDSAFKRRWDWQYVPISDAGKQWVIRVNGNDYSWWSFLEEINRRIYQATYSEDKKLGYFFCKAKDGVIDAETFVSKVVFYLWNDVFKDMEFEGDAFKDGTNGKLSFDKFYTVQGNETKVVSDKVELFLQNLGLKPAESEEEEEQELNTQG